MNFGIIGSAHGHIESDFIKNLLTAGCCFKGIVDDRREYAKAIAEHYNVPLFQSPEELFDQGIDLAGTSAVNNQKIDVIEMCAEHGVHIMADKPIVIDDNQYRRLKRVIDKGRIQIGLLLSVRFMPAIYTLKKLIDEDLIGQLLSIEIFNPHKLNPDSRPEWHFDKKQNGGMVIDLHIHSIDLFNWLTASTISEYSGIALKSILKEKPGFFDLSQFTVMSKSGVSGYFRADWHMPKSHWSWGDLRVFCTGSTGMIEVRAIGDPITRAQQVILFGNEKETECVDIITPEKNVTTDFLDRITGKPSSISHRDILNATKLSIEFDRCAREYIYL